MTMMTSKCDFVKYVYVTFAMTARKRSGIRIMGQAVEYKEKADNYENSY